MFSFKICVQIGVRYAADVCPQIDTEEEYEIPPRGFVFHLMDLENRNSIQKKHFCLGDCLEPEL